MSNITIKIIDVQKKIKCFSLINIAPNYVNSIELKFALGTDLSNVVRRIFLFIFPRRKIRVFV